MSLPLRIVRPEDETASELFESVVLPDLVERQRARATLADYRLHLSRWRDYWEWRTSDAEPPSLKDLASTRIMNPRAPGNSEPLAKSISGQDLIDWRRWLPTLLGEQCSPRNLNKHVQTMLAILAAGVTAERLTFVPKVKPLAEVKAAAKLYFTLEQVSQLYLAADAADWPKIGRLLPGDFWRTCFVMFFNYGFRTQELVAWEPDHHPLLVRSFFFDPESPHPDGHAENEHGWLAYTPQKQKRFKPRPLVLPLNPVVHAHIRLVLRSRRIEADEPLLPIPKCGRSFYAAWEQIVRAARIKPKPSLDGTPRFFELRHFRKSATTWLNVHRPGIAPYILGHAARDDGSSDVSDLHYDNQELRILEALTTFPQPPAFDQIFLRGARQQKLFD